MGVFSHQKNDDRGTPNALDAVLLSNYAYPATDARVPVASEVEQRGWRQISADALNYQGSVDDTGAFGGELIGYQTAHVQVLGKYDDNDNLTDIALAFRGTQSPSSNGIINTVGDVLNDLSAALPDDVWQQYAPRAFGELFSRVAEFAQANGLSGSDVLVTGHSLGGMGVNSMASVSDDTWGGFYADSDYVAFASPTQDDKVFNIGFENDPVFHVLPDNDISLPYSLDRNSPLAMDFTLNNGTNNLINFNDYYASELSMPLNESISNPSAWAAHNSQQYQSGVRHVLASQFYSLTHQDSTIVMSNLSDEARAGTWVEDRNMGHKEREGSVFLLGSEGDDLLRNNGSNAYMEGFDGNDTFSVSGGYAVIAGDGGDNTLMVDGSLNDIQTVFHHDVLYLKQQDGDLITASDISTVSGQEAGGLFGLSSTGVSYSVSDTQLVAQNDAYDNLSYTSSVDAEANTGDPVLLADDQWGFGSDGSDTIVSATDGGSTIISGSGDEAFYSQGGTNTFLFDGDFGHDMIYGFDASDTLVFQNIPGINGANYSDFVNAQDDRVTLTFDDGSVDLVGISADSLSSDQIVLV
ncbi:hypothetical protein [Carnimonas bestiolae]|uniref:hypothetical protein n=1 Tax=Carnimonas bestiolae TaxID=3402172 RepID=UPI003EDB6BF4